MNLHRRLSGAAALLALCACFVGAVPLVAQAPAQAQAPARPPVRPVVGKWTIDAPNSLAWWQVNPHYEHLWATSCPGDPFWMPGGGNDGGFEVDFSRLPKNYQGAGKSMSSPDQIPMFSRKAVRPVCGRSVRGELVMREAAGWNGISGSVEVDASSVITGNDNRDAYMFSMIEAGRFPTYSFRLDSLENVQAGDTVKATAVGVFTFRGVDKPVSVPVRAWRLGENKIRVKGKFMMDAQDLVRNYGISKFKLGMGVTQGLWKELHMGFDLVFVPPTP